MASENVRASTSVRKLEPTFKLPETRSATKVSPSDRFLLEHIAGGIVEFVDNALFVQSDAEVLFGDPLALIRASENTPRGQRPALKNDDSGAHYLISHDGDALEIDDERGLFLAFNYCRYRVFDVVENFAGKRLTAAAIKSLVTWQRKVMETRNELVRLNVPLVLAMVKRTKIENVDYSDLISEGNLALMRSVDKFDCARGYKFSTYACRAILKAFARVASRSSRYRGHFPVEFDPTLEKSDFVEKKRDHVEETCISEIQTILNAQPGHLNEIEQEVIKARFAVGSEHDDAQTLEQVGMMIGVTKERVRQIQNKALNKLRSMLEEGVLAV